MAAAEHERGPALAAGRLQLRVGDNDPNDKTQGTFFQVLPTRGFHAKFPFFNMMNLRDAFGSWCCGPEGR